MILTQLITVLLAISLVGSYPLEQYPIRQRRNFDSMNRRPADFLYQQLYMQQRQSMRMGYQTNVHDYLSKFRPVEGPMNIEHLPAMLAARNVRRYPYSQRDDPAIIGR